MPLPLADSPLPIPSSLALLGLPAPPLGRYSLIAIHHSQAPRAPIAERLRPVRLSRLCE